ncbi:hypothetical protein EMPS_00954 [Entomortierella parvispora]|uniref:Uncharacterized protein n=1 Tax=Entomortierella parvispora TaxID=205924 RepID=A0A9P3H2N0_9FUNG|nr:hypothetical protein EMPS_00954 [Entomortierella parvispora]
MSNTAMNTFRKKCSCAWAELAFMDPTWASKDCVRPNMCSDPDLASLLDQLKSQSLVFQCAADTNGSTAVKNQADYLLLGSKEGHGFWKWGIITLALTLGHSTSASFV